MPCFTFMVVFFDDGREDVVDGSKGTRRGARVEVPVPAVVHHLALVDLWSRGGPISSR